MTHARGLLVVALSLTLGGCATILGGKTQLITVNSNVSGAEVLLNDVPLGKTPLTATIKRGQTGVLRVRADGYQPYSIAMNKKISTLFWVNIFSGGAFGSSTDYSTGAMYEYEPSTFMVSLQPGRQSNSQRSDWQRREGLRGFVLLNSDALVSNLAMGGGEFVDVLTKILAVEPEGRAEAVARWRAEYSASKTAAEFAERMVAELGR